MRLQTYSVIKPWKAITTALAVVTITVRFYSIFGMKMDIKLLSLCVAIFCCGVIISRLKRVATLDVEKKLISIEIHLYSWILSKRDFLLSEYSWVRARLPDDDIERIVVEVGTRGYETVALLKLPYKAKQGIPEAVDICRKISSVFPLENWGYKDVT